MKTSLIGNYKTGGSQKLTEKGSDLRTKIFFHPSKKRWIKDTRKRLSAVYYVSENNPDFNMSQVYWLKGRGKALNASRKKNSLDCLLEGQPLDTNSIDTLLAYTIPQESKKPKS